MSDRLRALGTILRRARVLLLLALTAASLQAHNDDISTPLAERTKCIRRASDKKSPAFQSWDRPQTDFAITSPTGRFKIHYDTTGSNAVASADLNKNSIPDYIDSVAFYMDYAYRLEIDTLKFKAPPPDSVGATSWDVYVLQIGAEPGYYFSALRENFNGVYGLSFQEDSRLLPCNESYSTGFILLDNDFSIADSVTSTSGQTNVRRRVFLETGYEALKITCAHEFHHLVQFGYRATNVDPSFNELTSTWIEHRAFPASIDYLQHMSSLFRATTIAYLTDLENTQRAGYRNAFYLQFIQESSGDSVIRQTWDLLGTCNPKTNSGYNFYVALDSSLRRAGSSMEASWRAMMPWVYYTNYRSDGRHFANDKLMPALERDNSYQDFTEPSFTYSLSLYSYQFKLVRCVLPGESLTTPDTVDLLFVNTNTSDAIKSTRNNYLCNITISREANAGSRRIGNTKYYYSLYKSSEASIYDTLFVNGGFAVRQIPDPSPQPFIANSSAETYKQLLLPVPEQIPTGVTIRVEIASLAGEPVFDGDSFVEAEKKNSKRFAKWTPTDSVRARLSTGVYLYTISFNNEDYVGKFIVTNR